jgi:hypothetical protein
MSVQSYGKSVPMTQKVNFSTSQYYMHEYGSQSPEEVNTRDSTDGFITKNFRFLSVPKKKYLTYQMKKAFHNGKCPINVKQMDDIKQMMIMITKISGLLF